MNENYILEMPESLAGEKENPSLEKRWNSQGLLQPPTATRLAEVEDWNPLVSFFLPPIRNVLPSEVLSLQQVHRLIIGEEFAEITQKLRQLKDPGERRRFKASHFPYVTFSGVFRRRSDPELLRHSGLLVIDLDYLDDLPGVRKLLLQDPELSTELLFVSPSGQGLKWVVECQLEKTTHPQFFRAVVSYLDHTYGLKADVSGRDVSRACFLSQDPQAFLNPKYRWTEPPLDGVTAGRSLQTPVPLAGSLQTPVISPESEIRNQKSKVPGRESKHTNKNHY